MARVLQTANDRPIPIPIKNDGDSNFKFDIIRDNIEILWNRINELRNNQAEIRTQISSLQVITDPEVIETGSSLTLDEVILYLRSEKIYWDEIDPTTDSNDNVTQKLFIRNGLTVVTETRTYNGYGHISTQVLTGEVTGTWTHSYKADNKTWDGVVKT